MLEGFFVVADVRALLHADILLSMSYILQLQALTCGSTNKNVFLEVMMCIMVNLPANLLPPTLRYALTKYKN